MKRAISLAIAAVMTLSAVAISAQCTEAQGKSITIKSVNSLMVETALYDDASSSNILKVEAGNSFYMGDLIQAGVRYSNGIDFARYLTGLDAVYKSSNENVCSIDEKTGMVTPEEKGTAKITVKYKKKSAKVTVKVVKKGSFGSMNAKIEKHAKKITKNSKVYTGTFTKNNARKMIKAAKKCKNTVMPYYFKDYNKARYAIESGFGADKVAGGNYAQNNKLIYPGCLHYHAMDSNISAEIYVKYNPFFRHTQDPAIIQSVSANADSSQANITLNRSITELEYLMLSYSGDVINDGKPEVSFYTICSDEPEYFTVTEGAIQKNSNSVIATLSYANDKKFTNYIPGDTSADADNQQMAKKLTTFQKGVTYSFYTNVSFDESGKITYDPKDKSWTNNYQFTIK